MPHSVRVCNLKIELGFNGGVTASSPTIAPRFNGAICYDLRYLLSTCQR